MDLVFAREIWELDFLDVNSDIALTSSLVCLPAKTKILRLRECSKVICLVLLVFLLVHKKSGISFLCRYR